MSDIEKRLDALEAKMDDIMKMITAFKIDKQLMVQRGPKLKSGISCKVAYNSDGIIVGTQPLESSDIPQIPVSKISGLEDLIKTLVSKDQLETTNKRIDSLMHHGKTAKTGIKVNIDSRGFVNNVSDLLEEDIPLLSIEKIKGLRERLDQLNMSTSKPKQESILRFKAGTGCKVVFDNNGRITNTLPLQEEDIPNTIISRLNELETTISTKASSTDVENILAILPMKADKVQTVPGVYYKTQVNSDGQVISGSELTLDDIPQIPISKIDNLTEILSETASHSDVIDIKNSVETIRSEVKTPHEQPVLFRSAPDNTSELLREIAELDAKVTRLTSDTTYTDELRSIRDELSQLASKVNKLTKED